MTAYFINVLNMSITATYVDAVVIIARMFLRKAPKIYSYSLWSLVIFRLISPVSFRSSFSFLSRLNHSQEYIPPQIGMDGDAKYSH